MLKRHQELKSVLHQVDIDDIDEMLPTQKKNKGIEELCSWFGSLESATKILKSNSHSAPGARILFNGVIDMFPSIENRLSISTDIVHDKELERGVFKIQHGEISFLTRAERTAMVGLKLSEDNNSSLSSTESNLTFGVQHRKKSRPTIANSEYLDLLSTLPTSIICERLLSKVGCALNDRHETLAQVNLEQ